MIKQNPYLNLFRIIALCSLIQACNSLTWWQVMETTTTIRQTQNGNSIIKNSTQILSETDDVATARCKRMFGDYCIQCSNTICLKCNSSNLTLTNKPQNTTSKQVSFKYNACLCLSPYVLISQSPFSSSPKCSLCTESFSIFHCSPILYPSILGSPTLTPSTVVNGSIMQLSGFNGPVVGPTRDAATLTEMMTMDSQNYVTWKGNWGLASLGEGVNGAGVVEMVGKNFGIFFNGGQQEILGVTYQAKEVEGQVQINATIKNLYRNYYQYCKDKGYPIEKYFWIQLRKRKDAQGIFLNGTGNPLPKQYKVQLRLGSAYGYYVQAYDYMQYMNGTQVARIKMQTPSIFLAQTNSTTISTNYTITTNSSNSSISPNPSNSLNSTHNSNQAPTPSSPAPQSPQSPLTPYSVSHSFTPVQISIKQSIQFSLIFFTTFGLLGTGATNWLLLVLTYTDIFGNLGYFYLNDGINEPEINGTARRLFGEALPTVQVNVSTLNISQTVLDIAKSTLTMNPLVLLPTPFPIPTPLFSTPSPILAMALCLSLLTLYLTLVYISHYTRNKTNHTHSHIFHTLSSSSFPYRVLYLTIRGLYPILAYLFIGFAKGIIQGLMAGEGELRKNIQRDGNEAIWWHWAEIGAHACIGLAVIGGPIGGFMFFKKMDVENFYVYGRMFGNIVVEEKDKKQEVEDASNEGKKDYLREQISGNSCQQQSDDESGSSNSKNDQKQQHDQQSSHNIKQRKQKPKQNKKSNSQKNQPQKTDLQPQQPTSQQLKVPNPYSQPSQQKKFTPSLKPLLLHILQYMHIISFLILSSLVPSSSNPLLVPLLLLSFQSITLAFTFYCSFTVSLSKSYSVVKVVQYGLNAVYLLCHMLWADVGFFGWIGYYVYWGIGVWAIIGVAYQGLTGLYWEKRGVGVRGFFWNKIVVVVGNSKDGGKKDEQIQQSGVNLKKDNQEEAENKRQLIKPQILNKNLNKIVQKVSIDSKQALIKAKNTQNQKSIKAAATKARISKK